MENQQKKLGLWISVGITSVIGTTTVVSLALTQHRLRRVARLNRNGLTMDLQGIRHLVRQTTQGKWSVSDSQTLLAIRRSVFARVASLEVVDLVMSKHWTRLLNYLNLVMGYLGTDGTDNAELLKGFEQALTRLEAALDENRPSIKEVTTVLEELDRLI